MCVCWLQLQQQLAKVGIALDQRSYEFATFYSDVTRGASQIYSLRWIGGNEQPDIFGYAFSTARFSPKGANRGHYSNARLEGLSMTLRPTATTIGDVPTRWKRSRFWRAICPP